jgi:hydrogenase maturation protease
VSEAPEPGGRIVVIGVGNELMRDEGVGVVVARALQGENLPEGVEVVEGGVAGLDLLFEMEGADRAVIVDAAEMGLEPGAIRVFTPDELEFEGLGKLASLHHISLLDVLELGKLTGLQTEVVIVGLQPAEVAPGSGLTPQVGEAVGRAVEEVKRLVATGKDACPTERPERQSRAGWKACPHGH